MKLHDDGGRVVRVTLRAEPGGAGNCGITLTVRTASRTDARAADVALDYASENLPMFGATQLRWIIDDIETLEE